MNQLSRDMVGRSFSLVLSVASLAATGAAQDPQLRLEVVDPRGEPVAGAAIRVSQEFCRVFRPERLGPPREPVSGLYAPGTRKSLASLFPLHAAGDRSVRADASGRATLSGLARGRLEVVAWHPDYAFGLPTVVTLRPGQPATVRLALPAGGAATVRAVDAKGLPLPRHLVRITGPLGGKLAPWCREYATDAAGTKTVAKLAAGRYRATVCRPTANLPYGLPYGRLGTELTSSAVEFTVRPGATAPVTVAYPAMTVVTGTITGAHGPVAGVDLVLGKPNGWNCIQLQTAQSDAQGRFRLEAEPGTFRLNCSRSARYDDRIEVTAGQATLRRDVALGTASLTIRVVSAESDTPLAAAEVRLRVATPLGPRTAEGVRTVAWNTVAMTTASGEVKLDGIADGTYHLKVSRRGCADRHMKNIVVPPGGELQFVKIRLQRGVSVHGSVTPPRDATCGGVVVQYRQADGTALRTASVHGDRFHLDGLPPGKYELRARYWRYSGEGTHVRPTEISWFAATPWRTVVATVGRRTGIHLGKNR